MAAVEQLGPLFAGRASVELPGVRVSVGWPGGRGRKDTVIGQCWPSKAAADGKAQLFVSPVLDDPILVLATLTHELVHAADDCKSKHRGEFVRIARAIGLEGKMTATVAGEALRADLTALAECLGDYPHAALSRLVGGADEPKKQGTRMLKVECAHSDEDERYLVRMTKKWIEDVGLPICPCHSEPMELAA